MTNPRATENGRGPADLSAGASVHPPPPVAPPEIASGPAPEKSRCPTGWQMVALWLFIALSFVVLALTGYLIWAKCQGRW